VIYTSGSTGRPKGVAMSHAGLSNQIAWITEATQLSAEDALLQRTSICFDASVWELFSPLVTGGRLCLARGHGADIEAMLTEVSEHRITHLQLVPSLLDAFGRSADARTHSLKALFVGGGALYANALPHFTRDLDLPVYNLYGPTETCVQSTSFTHNINSPQIGSVPIGRPIHNTKVYILDIDFSPMPIGLAGELYISGEGLARGYLNQPGLTADRFIPNPFDPAGGRLYRTGDKARWLSDGALEYLGRLDDQVKIRGHRIELSEVEVALLSHRDVGQAIVVASEFIPDDTKLVAYVVEGRTPDSEGPPSDEKQESIDLWRSVFEDTYSEAIETVDGPDFRGWTSSYDGAPIAIDEMSEWLGETIKMIRRIGFDRVVEIGCGIGLVVEKLAPEASRYVATDFSAEALAGLSGWTAKREEFQRTEFVQAAASSLDGVLADSCDLAVLNSVVQYFPSDHYLEACLSEARRVVGSRGAIFIGDVRNLDLLEAFHSSVQFSRASDDQTVTQIRSRVRRAMEQEKELLLAPRYFSTSNTEHISAKIILKRGLADNELTRYRYDVVLSPGHWRHPSAEQAWQGLESFDAWLSDIRDRSDLTPLVVRDVPNSRLNLDQAVMEALASSAPSQTVGQIRLALRSSCSQPETETVENLCRRAEALGFAAHLLPASSGDIWRCDILLVDPSEPFAGDMSGAPSEWIPQSDAPLANAPHLALSASERTAAVKAHLARFLPDHMIPSTVVWLDSLPLTPNGKVDRAALPAPDLGISTVAYAAPRTPVEVALAAIWTEILHADRVGLHDNFFDLGGHSLLATQVVVRVRQTLGLSLPIRAIFEAPVLEDAAHVIEEMLRGRGAAQLPTLEPRERPARLPLSYAQERLWFLDQLGLVGSAYNVVMGLQLTGELKISALEEAIEALLQRHESLRTRFVTIDGEVEQVIDPSGSYALAIADVSDAPSPEVAAKALAQAEVERPFALSTGPLFRCVLIRQSARVHLLCITMHHIVSDGWSVRVLSQELGALYGAFCRGRPNPLPTAHLQYADYTLWQREWLDLETIQSQTAYWRSRLAGAPELLELPYDRPRPATASFRGGFQRFEVSPELSGKLAKLARQEGATLFMVLMAAFKTLLSRWSGQEDIVVGTPIAGRTDRASESLIGFFVNMLPLRSQLSRDMSFRTLLAQVKEAALEAYAHQDLPFEKLVAELQPARSLSHQPIFQVSLAVQNTPEPSGDWGDIEAEHTDAEYTSALFDMTLHLRESPEGLRGGFEFATDLFDAQTLERLSRQFSVMLEGICADPDSRLGQLPLMDDAERRRVLIEWNATDRAVTPSCVHDLFVEQTRRTPAAAAVIFGGEQLSYEALDRRSNQLARHLRDLGVGPDTVVGLCVQRSLDMVVALLAVLKAGGAYLPLDPDYPSERLAFMLRDAQAGVVIGQTATLEDLSVGKAEVVVLDKQQFEIERYDDAPLDTIVHPENLAYVIYTSGSTGRPKGVAMSHAGLLNMLRWQIEDSGPVARTLQFTSLSFDVSAMEIFSNLATGGSLQMVDEDTRRDTAALADLIDTQDVSRLFLPFVALNAVSADIAQVHGDLSLCEINTAGERLVITQALRTLFRQRPEVRLTNQYGPTETHLATAYRLAGDADQWPAAPPIGRPITNTKVYVLDEDFEIAPLGFSGELYIGGDGLARGYQNAPGLTADRFCPDPFGLPGARLYRTGDKVRWRDDGELIFLGRSDNQIKLNGYRIELDEVEAALLSHSLVTQAAVVVREDSPTVRRLVGYFACDSQTVSPQAVRDHLRRRLPEHMTPTVLIVLERLPLTPSGKIDRRALADRDIEAAVQQYVEPDSPIAVAIAEIWAEVLGQDRIGLLDNFFERGGHSLLAARLSARIKDLIGVSIPPRRIFEATTLSEYVDAVLNDVSNEFSNDTTVN